jgi:hypothetical protein
LPTRLCARVLLPYTIIGKSWDYLLDRLECCLGGAALALQFQGLRSSPLLGFSSRGPKEGDAGTRLEVEIENPNHVLWLPRPDNVQGREEPLMGTLHVLLNVCPVSLVYQLLVPSRENSTSHCMWTLVRITALSQKSRVTLGQFLGCSEAQCLHL